MSSKRKGSSDDDFARGPKRPALNSTSGKQRSAPINVEELPAPQGLRRDPASKLAIRKPRPSDIEQRGKPGVKPVGYDGSKKEAATPSQPAATAQAPPGPPKPKRVYRFIKPLPTAEQAIADEFPVYKDGGVDIVLDDDHIYRLHSSTLNRAGKFFKDDAKVTMNEPGENWLKKIDMGGMKRYEMVAREDEEGFVLVRKVLTAEVIPEPKVDEPTKANEQAAPDSMAVDALGSPVLDEGRENTTVPMPRPLDVSTDRAGSREGTDKALSTTDAGSNDASKTVTTLQKASVPLATSLAPSIASPAASQPPGLTPPAHASELHSAQEMVSSNPEGPIKAEDGSYIKAEPGTEADCTNGSNGSIPRSRTADDRNPLDMFPLKNGRPTIPLGGVEYYVSPIEPTAEPHVGGKLTTTLFGVDYLLEPVNPAPPAAQEASALEDPDKDENHDEEMEDEDLDVPFTTTTPNSCPPLTRADWVFGFHAFFQIVYNIRPSPISSTSLSDALQQCEGIVAAAKSIGGVPVVTREIGDAILGVFGKAVYISIQDNPRRWLKFAVDLKHVAIFNEAVVHVIGLWPDHIVPETFGMLNKATVDLLYRKARELNHKIWQMSSKLIAASPMITPEGGEMERVRWKAGNSQEFDIWIIAQLWRDWYCEELQQALTPRLPENYKVNPCDVMHKMGYIFRLIDDVDGYLTKEDVGELVKCYRFPPLKNRINMTGLMVFATWEEDLTKMKLFAKETLKPLMVNNSMLPRNENGITYLTCTTVAEDERPWEKD